MTLYDIVNGHELIEERLPSDASHFLRKALFTASNSEVPLRAMSAARCVELNNTLVPVNEPLATATKVQW